MNNNASDAVGKRHNNSNLAGKLIVKFSERNVTTAAEHSLKMAVTCLATVKINLNEYQGFSFLIRIGYTHEDTQTKKRCQIKHSKNSSNDPK